MPTFLENKYTKWYFSIISNAQSREVSGYIEKHHIIPKSLGGRCKLIAIKGELKFQD
jgi:hypothetical protein